MDQDNLINLQNLTDSQLLERIFLKVAIIQSDIDLEKFLQKYFCDILLKFDSPDEQVRNKLIELLTHLKKRIIDRPNVALPLFQMLVRLKQDHSITTVNFLIVFIRIGLPRCSDVEKSELFPILTDCFKGKSSTVQRSLVQFLTPMLASVKYAGVSDTGYSVLPFTWSQFEEIKALITEYLYYYLLLPYNIGKLGDAVPPGFSQKGLETLKANNNNLPIEDALEEVKLSILEFLTTEHFKSPKDSFPLLVIASGDPRERVKEKADKLRDKTPLIEWIGSIEAVKRLYIQYLGGPMCSIYSTPLSAKRAKAIPEDEKASPVDCIRKMKIFPPLLESFDAHNEFPECIQIVCQSLHGNATNTKLMEQALKFSCQMCEKTTDKKFNSISHMLEKALESFVRKNVSVKLKKECYKALEHLAKHRPVVFRDKLQFFLSMFESLMVVDDKDLRQSIYNCISFMTNAFKSPNSEVEKTLETQLPIYLEEESSQVRLATIRCCHRIFSPTHVLSRYLMLIGAGDQKGEVREEAMSGLSLKGKGKDEVPDFKELLRLLVSKGMKSSTKFVSTVGELPFKPIVLVKILEYLDQLIVKSSGSDAELVPTKQLERKKCFLKENEDILPQYVELIMHGLEPGADSALNEVSLRSLKCVFQCIPEFTHEIDNESIERILDHANPDTRHIAAAVVGLIMREKTQHTAEVVESLLDIPNEANNENNSLLNLGYVLGYVEYNSLPLIDAECITKSLDILTTSVKSEASSIARSACDSLSIILAHHPSSEVLSVNLEELFEAVSKMISSSKSDISCKESGFQLLGVLAVCRRKEDFLRRVCDCLLKQHSLQGADLHLRIAESLSLCVVGNRSKAFQFLPFLHVSVKYEQTPDGLDHCILQHILTSVFRTLSDERVVKRGYSVPIWLLSLLQLVIVPFQQLSELEQIHASLLLILFRNNNNLSQEAASIGLYILSKITTGNVKRDLLALMQKCMGKMNKEKLQLRKKNESKSLQEILLDRSMPSNYKKVYDLSNILKDPSVNYPLINLARQCTICKIQRAQKLDLENLKNECVAQLQSEVTIIIPKLFYYTHDPNHEVQQTMQYIWISFVKDPNKVIDQNFKAILTELIVLLAHKDWCYRQGSCNCLRAILCAQPFRSFAEYLPDLWELILKNVDDPKESVRNFASLACDVLASVTIRICDASNSRELAGRTLELILPRIIHYAMNSLMPRVKSFCLCITRVIANNSGDLVKPYVLDIIPPLLMALSDLECNALSEMSVRADQDQISQERVESIRLELNSCSPIMETIKTCIKYVDTKILGELLDRLSELASQTNIGLNTIVGCGKVVSVLAVNFDHALVPYTKKLIRSFMRRMNHRSLSVKRTYASTISQLAKIGEETAFEKLIKIIKNFYLDEDSDQQLNACLLLQAMNQNCADFTNHFKSELLPLVYFALHGKVISEEETRGEEDSARHVNNALWADIWDNLAPYKELNLVLYLDEVVKILQENLDHRIWERREQSLKALINLVDKIPEEFSINQIDTLLAVLMKYLPGRVWEGKVHIPRAVELLSVKCSEKIKTHGLVHSPSMPDLIKELLREGSRVGTLQKGAIQALGSIIEHYKSDKYHEFFRLAYSQLHKLSKSNDRDYEANKNNNEMTMVIFSALAKVFPDCDQKKYLKEFFTSAAQLINQSAWKVHLSVLESLESVCDKIVSEESPELVTESINLVLKPVIISTGNQMKSAIRGQSLKVLLKLLDLLEKCKSLDKVLTIELDRLQAKAGSAIKSEHSSLLGRVVVYFDRVANETNGEL